MKSVSKFDFKAFVTKEYSFKPLADQLGEKDCTMEFFTHSGSIEKDGNGTIEWIVNEGEEIEHIGIWWENKTLTDYDGVFELNEFAIKFLRKMGITVPKHYED